MTYIEKLLSISGSDLSKCKPQINQELYDLSELANELLNFLNRRNGFYAFESALHVFPSHATQEEFSIEDWNSHLLWRNLYSGLDEGCLFFAEDVFGGQFCCKDNKIYTFDPETGLLNYLADHFEEWAKHLLDDYEFLTGYSLAKTWQKIYGSLPRKKRLVPKKLFVVGGEFALNNLYLCDSVEAMRFRAEFANQIKNLPDGTKIVMDMVE